MSFSNKNPINLHNNYTKKYQNSKKVKLINGPISVKASKMSNILGFDNKVKGNIISSSYFNLKIYKNKRKNQNNEKLKNENQTNYYSLFFDNNQNSNNSKVNIKKINNNNSYFYSKISLNSLIRNNNNIKSKIINKRNKNILNEVLKKYSNHSSKTKMKNIIKNDITMNNKRNSSFKNYKSNNLTRIKQNIILSTENIFNNSHSTSNINRKKRNSVLKIEQKDSTRNMLIKNYFTNTNNRIIKKEDNINTYINRDKRKMNKIQKIKLMLFSRNNTISNNVKILKNEKSKKNESNMKHNKSSYFNFSTSDIRRKINNKSILNIDDIRMNNKYIVTPKNFQKDSEIISKEKNKIERRYMHDIPKREIIKQKPIYKFIINKKTYINLNSKENQLNNILIKKINSKNTLYKRHKNYSISIIDIFKKKKSNSKINKTKWKNSNNDTNINNKTNKIKKSLNENKNISQLIKNNKIENKLFNENNITDSTTDDNFDDLYSIIKKLKFNSINSQSIFDSESLEYKNYIKKFNSFYNNYYTKYQSKIKQKSKNVRKSSSKIFIESTRMKTSSHTKKLSYKNIDTNNRIREFKLDD